MGVARVLARIARAGYRPEALFEVLMAAAADAMLHFDARYRHGYDVPVSQNVDWLDFTHAITHLNAVRHICTRQPALWPNALLQCGCFLGRNAGFVNWDQDVSNWVVDDCGEFLSGAFAGMLDHGQPLYIVSAHQLKLTTAVREEVERSPEAAWVPVVLAALNRFLHEPAKMKHARRTAHQAVRFVEVQG